MALIECSFFSQVLQLQCAMRVILPDPASTTTQRPPAGWPTLYLLHGLSDDHTMWTRQTSLERYVDKMPLAVVMPAVNRSFYSDMASGPRYGEFIAHELPRLARYYLPLSGARGDTFVAGLSMGGYGAFKLALTYPQSFGAAASLSGALDISHRATLASAQADDTLARIFGAANTLPGGPHDLFALAEQAAQGGTCPRLYQCCGHDDFLFADNQRFADHATALGLPHEAHFAAGDHTWAYWDQQIQRVLAWLPAAVQRA